MLANGRIGIRTKRISRSAFVPARIEGMLPTPRERLDARIRNKEALALRRKASAELAETGRPAEPALRAAYDKGRADAFAELAAVRRREEDVAAVARDYAKQNKKRREIAAAVRASVAKPRPRVLEAVVVVKALATEVLVAAFKHNISVKNPRF
jgi:hypothetical protein